MKKILLIDDSSVDVMLITIALDECSVPHKLSIARDGDDAYHMLTGTRFDLLLLDIKMPRVDGFELLERVRNDGRKPVTTFIISSSGLESDRLRARELGAAEFIQKAVDFSAFKNELSAALRKYNLC